MVTFRSNNNNNRRPPFRSNNNNRRPPFRSNNEGSRFSNNDNFQRKVPGRNNHNASKLIEKYNEMAREALANEDRVLSENYFQHADHFTRVQNEQESIRVARINSSQAGTIKTINTVETATPVNTVETATPVNTVETATPVNTAMSVKVDQRKEVSAKPEVKKPIKINEKKLLEKKSATS